MVCLAQVPSQSRLVVAAHRKANLLSYGDVHKDQYFLMPTRPFHHLFPNVEKMSPDVASAHSMPTFQPSYHLAQHFVDERHLTSVLRSEERRVGQECGQRWWRDEA